MKSKLLQKMLTMLLAFAVAFTFMPLADMTNSTSWADAQTDMTGYSITGGNVTYYVGQTPSAIKMTVPKGSALNNYVYGKISGSSQNVMVAEKSTDGTNFVELASAKCGSNANTTNKALFKNSGGVFYTPGWPEKVEGKETITEYYRFTLKGYDGEGTAKDIHSSVVTITWNYSNELAILTPTPACQTSDKAITLELCASKALSFTATPSVAEYDVTWINNSEDYLTLTRDTDDPTKATVEPKDKCALATSISAIAVDRITKKEVRVDYFFNIVKEGTLTEITIPEGASIELGTKGGNGDRYYTFHIVEPKEIKDNKYTFDLPNGDYVYVVRKDGLAKYVNKFTKDKYIKQIAIDGIQLTNEAEKIDRAPGVNGRNVADVFTNINEKNFLKMEVGDTKEIIAQRNWQAVDNITNNYHMEPDYHFTVIDENGNPSDVVKIEGVNITGQSYCNGRNLTAIKEGTAIVLVTYDAMNEEFGQDGPFYGAIWPENTGVFVVQVGAGNGDTITTNIKLNEGKNKVKETGKWFLDSLDSEVDPIYYLTEFTEADGTVNTIENAHAEFTFTPSSTSGTVNVYLAKPTVTDAMSFNGFQEINKNADGSYTLNLIEGRNIVKITDGTNSAYQVITAKGVKAKAENVTHPNQGLVAGDEFKIIFDRIYHPANKLAGLYNHTAALEYNNVEGYDGKSFLSSSAQYNFAYDSGAQTVSCQGEWQNTGMAFKIKAGDKLKVPEEYNKDSLTLSDGVISVCGFGNAAGNHRLLTLEKGSAANMAAATVMAKLAKLPDITVSVLDKSEVKAITKVEVESQPDKTSYYEGETFDSEGLSLKITYEDQSEKIVTRGFTVVNSVMGKDTEKVQLMYGGISVDITVSVTPQALEELRITNAPDKTVYEEGEYFVPTGMIVQAKYNNGATQKITDYSYSSEQLKKDQTYVVISYAGKSVSQSITVRAKTQEPQTEESVRVYFTLLGDAKHGNPVDESGTHTLKSRNLQTWIAKTAVEVPKNSTVNDVVTKALSMNGMGFSNAGGNYISEINGLAEFDNGSLSGWMYTLNGTHPNLGVGQQKVKNGDVIVFHYTDDYTKEEGSEKWTTPEDEGSTPTVTEGADGSVTAQATAEVKVTGDTAKATVDSETAAELVKQAKDNKATEVKLEVKAEDTKDAKAIQAELPKSVLSDIAGKTDAALVLATPQGEVKLDNKVLDEIAKVAAGSNVTIEIKAAAPTLEQTNTIGKSAQVIELTITSGSETIGEFNGGTATFASELPKALDGKRTAAVCIKADGTLEVLPSKVVEVSGKKHIEFTTSHFSTFAIVDADEAGIEEEQITQPEKKNEKLIAGVKATTIKAKSKIVKTKKGKKAIKISWSKSKGYKVDYYQIYRSTTKAKNFKKMYTTKSGNAKYYTNTKSIKKGKTYYYKVRGVRTINGKKYYTKWSNVKKQKVS